MNDNNSNISSEDLAVLICDALIDADIIKTDKLSQALEITTKEIDVRKNLKDYWCSTCPNIKL